VPRVGAARMSAWLQAFGQTQTPGKSIHGKGSS
jgi:hypothetical protein